MEANTEIKSELENLVVYHTTKNGEQILKKIWYEKDLKENTSSVNFKTKKIKVKKISLKPNEDVYDLTVKDNRNFFGNGILVHNCSEIGFIPITVDGVCGFQFCNLTSINGAKVKTMDLFLQAIEAAVIIGTLQATYTNFSYLNKAAQILTEEEALLGVSITGIMDSPDLFLNPKYLYIGSKYAAKVNEEWSKIVGIKQAARITCVKPEGTNALIMESASGVHPHHAKPRYFRRIQMNKSDSVYKFFKKHNKHLCEESVWSATKSDDVITFPVEVSDTVLEKDDFSAIKHLDTIRMIQENWVLPGTTEANKKPISHNVSCTVIVDNDEWDQVIDYVYEHKNSFTGISFLGKGGDKSFPQAPVQKVYPEDEAFWKMAVEKYKPVDYSKFFEDDDKTNRGEEAACAGGSCEISVL